MNSSRPSFNKANVECSRTNGRCYSTAIFNRSDGSSSSITKAGDLVVDKEYHNVVTRKIVKDGSSSLSHHDSNLLNNGTLDSNGQGGKARRKSEQDEGIIIEEVLQKGQTTPILCLRSFTVTTIVIATVLVCILTYVFAYSSEFKEFEHHYRDMTETVQESFHRGLRNAVYSTKTLAAMYISHFGEQNEWPNATMYEFKDIVEGQYAITEAVAFTFSPIVTPENRVGFEAHAAENRNFLGVSQLVNNYTIYRIENGLVIDDPGVEPDSPFPDIMVPLYQIYPSEPNWKAIMFNLHSENNRMRAIDDMLMYKVPTLTSLLHLVTHDDGMNPSSVLFYPVFSQVGSDQVVGTITVAFTWESLLRKVLNDHFEGLIAVLESSASVRLDPINGVPRQLWTYEIVEDKGIIYSEGDLHDPKFDKYEYEINTSLFIQGLTSIEDVDNLITYKVRLYPSNKMKHHFVSKRPVTYTIVMLFIFIFVSLVFLVYDYLNTLQKKKVTLLAKKSGQIIDNLFPVSVKNRLFDQSENLNLQLRECDNTDNHVDDPISNLRKRNHAIKRYSRLENDGLAGTKADRMKRFFRLPTRRLSDGSPTRRLSDGSHEVKTDNLLKINTPPIADLFPETSIMFADLVGFTSWSANHEPEEVFHLLETIFFEFDKIAQRLNVFKLGTIGDCYIAVTGIPDYMPEHAVVMCQFAQECRVALKNVLIHLETFLGNVTHLSMRYGIHSGPVTAGVLRGFKSRFELFGDTINTASRMESTSKPEMIQISQSTATYLIDAGHSDWFEPREDTIEAKGKGELQTYWLFIEGKNAEDVCVMKREYDQHRIQPFYHSSDDLEESSEHGNPQDIILFDDTLVEETDTHADE